jgi:hypothetical protein
MVPVGFRVLTVQLYSAATTPLPPPLPLKPDSRPVERLWKQGISSIHRIPAVCRAIDMQKVEGSSLFSRSLKIPPIRRGFFIVRMLRDPEHDERVGRLTAVLPTGRASICRWVATAMSISLSRPGASASR